jgi:hypothetical protein
MTRSRDVANIDGILTAKGDIYAATAAATPDRLGVGANNTVLTADSATATGLKWVAPAGAGKVLQVLSTVKTDTFSSSTTGAFTDITGMSIAITPTLATSKILVLVNLSVACTQTNTTLGWRIMRDATSIVTGDASGSRISSSMADLQSDANAPASSSMTFLDAPATTSAITYKCQFYVANGSFFLNRSNNDTNNAVNFRTASTITVMEIGA